MAEEAKDSPGKTPPCEWPEGALDLLKQLTKGKPGTRATDGWKTWEEIEDEMNEQYNEFVLFPSRLLQLPSR